MERIPCNYSPDYLLMIFVPILFVIWLVTLFIADGQARSAIRMWLMVVGSGLILASFFAPEVFCKRTKIGTVTSFLNDGAISLSDQPPATQRARDVIEKLNGNTSR